MATFEIYLQWAKQQGLKANKARTLKIFFQTLR